MSWRTRKESADSIEAIEADHRADEALQRLADAAEECTGALHYLKREADSNNFSRNFIAMIEGGRS